MTHPVLFKFYVTLLVWGTFALLAGEMGPSLNIHNNDNDSQSIIKRNIIRLFHVYLENNDYESAQKRLKALTPRIKSLSVENQIDIFNIMGIIASRTFHEKDAIKYYKYGLNLISQTDNAKQLCIFIENIAALYVRLANTGKAAEYLSLAESLYHQLNEPLPLELLNNLGTNEFYQDNQEKALDYHKIAYERLCATYIEDIPKEYYSIIYNLAWDYLALNNAEQALSLLQQFIATRPEDYELKSRIIYVQAMDNHNSNVMSDIKQLQTEPLSGLAKALLHLALAEIARREQNWETVAEHLIQAFQVSLGASFISDRLSSLPPQFRSMQRRYLLIADALCRANKDKEAWTWLQYANSQVGKELLTQSSTNAKLETVLQAERKILSLHEQYDNIELAMTEHVNDLLQLEREYEDAKRELRKSNPAIWEELFSERVNVHPDDLDQIRFRLPEDTILLEPAIMDSQVAIFICSRQNGVRLKTIPMQNAERRIKGLIIQYRQAMASPGDIATAQNIGKKLYDILLLPVAEDIRALNPKTILYSPAGILRYVSLATLYDGNHYLMEQYNTANLSGYDLIRLGTDEQVPASGFRFVGFANPDGTLPASDIECSEIAGLFPKSTVFSQHNATLKQFLALTGDASFVHLATHGVLNPESPEESYLVFAEDKFQYKDMIAGIPMMNNLGMLTLSACNTANVNPSAINNNAMEIYGMAYQFVHKTHSGATLATLWPVSDSHTRQLMTTMYSQLLSNATNTGHWHRAQCLADAQRQLHATPASEHPFFWGAFILIGNFK